MKVICDCGVVRSCVWCRRRFFLVAEKLIFLSGSWGDGSLGWLCGGGRVICEFGAVVGAPVTFGSWVAV